MPLFQKTFFHLLLLFLFRPVLTPWCQGVKSNIGKKPNLPVAFNTILPSTDAEAEYLLQVEAKALNIAEKPCSLKARLRLNERKIYLHLATCSV